MVVTTFPIPPALLQCDFTTLYQEVKFNSSLLKSGLNLMLHVFDVRLKKAMKLLPGAFGKLVLWEARCHIREVQTPRDHHTGKTNGGALANKLNCVHPSSHLHQGATKAILDPLDKSFQQLSTTQAPQPIL